MASPFQQQSLRRKLVYFALIVGLFTAAVILRRYPAYGMEAQAQQLEIREQNLGEVELTGAALRLTLTGSRGMAVCYLWILAQDKKMRHEWNELDMIVRSLIKLQPHFISPWIFQSWNLTYNVSVECDRVKDKYFYIARGIQLLAEGERQNRNVPTLRYYVGFFTQGKFGISDEQNTLRTLFQLSCMDTNDRDPSRYRQIVRGRSVVNMDKFEEFCRKNPFLVRRLRTLLRCKNPEDVVEFLAANQRIPSRFEDSISRAADFDYDRPASPMRAQGDRFPVLPPEHSEFDPADYTDDVRDLEFYFDNYFTARAWYGYSQDPLKDPRQRAPMARLIFQGYPARAQAFIAERQQQEGWFDQDGWELAGWFPVDPAQPDGAKKTVVVGDGRPWGEESWGRAYEMYRRHGIDHELYKTPKEMAALSTPDVSRIQFNQGLTNFNHFYYRSEVERNPDTVQARKAFYLADRLRRTGERARALQMYESPAAFGPPSTWDKSKATGWKRILMSHPEFRNDMDQQEESYTNQRRYLNLVRDLRLAQYRPVFVAQDFLSQGTMGPGVVQVQVPIHLVPSVDVIARGPLDDVDDQGEDFIGPGAILTVNQRMGLPTDPELFARAHGSKRPSTQPPPIPPAGY
jgi:hypothetical protein